MKRVCLIIIITATAMIHAVAQDIKLIMRADDMGFSRAANLAIIQTYQEGIVTTVEVLSAAPWFPDAARLLNENPGLDVGVHLTLTSEWNNIKWGPVSNAPSLRTTDGYFPASTEEMLAMDKEPGEIKAEFEAQIDLALKYIPHVSHLSTHMFNPRQIPEIYSIIEEISEEYGLPFKFTGINKIDFFWNVAPENKEQYLADFLNSLGPGLHFFGGVHPALSNEETRVLEVEGSSFDANLRVAEHRQIVTDVMQSQNIKEIIEAKGIKLVSFGEVFAPELIHSQDINVENQIFPNPFDTSATILVNVQDEALTKISIFDESGKQLAVVCNNLLAPGNHKFIWDADEFPSGMYLCEIQMGKTMDMRKLQKLR